MLACDAAVSDAPFEDVLQELRDRDEDLFPAYRQAVRKLVLDAEEGILNPGDVLEVLERLRLHTLVLADEIELAEARVRGIRGLEPSAALAPPK